MKNDLRKFIDIDKSHQHSCGPDDKNNAFAELKQSVFAALEIYANVHRGSGHKSMASTFLYEKARTIVLDFLKLDTKKFILVFGSPSSADNLENLLSQKDYLKITSKEIGLPIGVHALAIKRKALPVGAPSLAGGGTARLMGPDWVIWAKAPDKFEAGTPAIINVIAFAKALQLIRKYGDQIFLSKENAELMPDTILNCDKLKADSGQALLDELRGTCIGHGKPVPSATGKVPYVNLDNSASTPTFRPVWDTFYHTLKQSEEHQQELVKKVRLICAEMLSAPGAEYDLIFTSNTTEAINLAAESLKCENQSEYEKVVLGTFLEHSSNDLPWRGIPECTLIRCSADNEGFVDLVELESILSAYNKEAKFGKKRIRIVALTGASNVLGTFNKLGEISKIVHRYGAQLLVDGAQLVPHQKVDMKELDIDYLAFSGHKVYAPFGAGVLLAKKGLLNFSPSELVKHQRMGEENAAGIAALGKAFSLLQRIGMDLIYNEEQALTRLALEKMSKLQHLKIHGLKDLQSPRFNQKLGVIAFDVKGLMADKVAKELALQGGIGVRNGCMCAHILVKRILGVGNFLEKFQRIMLNLLPKVQLPGLTRVSFGIENTPEDIDRLVETLQNIGVKRSKASKDEKLHISHAEVQKQMDDFIKESSVNVFS